MILFTQRTNNAQGEINFSHDKLIWPHNKILLCVQHFYFCIGSITMYAQRIHVAVSKERTDFEHSQVTLEHDD